MDLELLQLIELIENSLDKMPQEYFNITTSYVPFGIVRERAFCYELYHQMRSFQDKKGLKGVVLHGEIDKRGHPHFSNTAKRNPDFIFHVPGTMEKNSIVIEVKGNIKGGYKQGVFKDIQTLSIFTDEYHKYRLGVLIIYNYSLEEFKRYVSEYVRNKNDSIDFFIKYIIVICKKSPNHPMETGLLSSILSEVILCQN